MVAAAPAAAAVGANCSGCVLGIWDGPDIDSAPRHGHITPGVVKDVYLGLCASTASLGIAVDAMEFSIEGIDPADGVFVTGVEFLTRIPPVQVGTFGAPPGYYGVGGVLLIWDEPIAPSGAFLRLTLVTLGPVVNRVLHVLQKFPQRFVEVGPFPAVWNYRDYLRFTRVNGGCYLLNWDGTGNPPCFFLNPPCTVAVQPATWAAVKTLYRP